MTLLVRGSGRQPSQQDLGGGGGGGGGAERLSSGPSSAGHYRQPVFVCGRPGVELTAGRRVMVAARVRESTVVFDVTASAC